MFWRSDYETDHPCVEEGSCEKLSGHAYCCVPGFIVKDNDCHRSGICENHPGICGHGECVDRGGLHDCHCAPGFVTDGTTCISVLEKVCAQLNCAHECTDFGGSTPHCECRRGYSLVNGTQCREDPKVCTSGYHWDDLSSSCRALGPDPQLIFVDGSIGKAYGMPIHAETPVSALAQVSGAVQAVGYDSTRHIGLFVGDILTVVAFGEDEPQYESSARLNRSARALALDWGASMLYLLDNLQLSLWNVSGGKPRFEATLLEHGGAVHDVVVVPTAAMLFWAGGGIVTQALLSGRRTHQIFNAADHGTVNVTSDRLAVDATDLLNVFLYYAADRTLFCFDTVGRRRVTLTAGLPGDVLAMDVFEDWVYMVIRGQTGWWWRDSREEAVGSFDQGSSHQPEIVSQEFTPAQSRSRLE